MSGTAATGLGATYGSLGVLDRSVASIRNVGGVTGATQPLEAAQAPQQPAATQAPQQPAPAQASQEPASAQGPQQPPDTQAVPQPEATQAPQQPATTQAPHSAAYYNRRQGDVLRESLMTSGPMEQQQQGRDLRYPPLRLSTPRRPAALREFEQQLESPGQVAEVPEGDVQGEPGRDQFLSPGAMTSAQSYVSAQSQEVQEGASRSLWMNFGEMFQRRVVAPVVNAGRSLTTSANAQGPMEASTSSLFSSEVQRALEFHRSRPSLISPQHCRQEEEASSSSVNQEMIMDEVKRQVAMAMQGRDQEVTNGLGNLLLEALRGL